MKNVEMGIWIFKKKSLTIENKEDGYTVDLESITSSGEMLDWILQISYKKNYDSCNFLKLLIYAIEWHFKKGPQGIFCPFGQNIENISWHK
jgi:hypothetical protein